MFIRVSGGRKKSVKFVATASAIGAKKIQVVLDSPATDTTKAKIIIKKGAVDVNTDKVTFSDDKKTALVETAAKLTKGDYTITVSGVATKDITTKLTAEDEKVAKIDVTTKTAPYIVTSDANSKKKALVSYKVYNQYGEDVTSATQGISWTVSTGVKIENSDVNVADGTVKITNSGNAEFIPGSKVYLTGVYATTGVVVNAELTVGVESKADQVVFKGVYNKSTKKFESLPANFADDKYLLLFDVNDQYGKAFNNYKALNDLVGNGLTIPENSEFVEQNDGTAKLVYTANVTNPDETLGTPVWC